MRELLFDGSDATGDLLAFASGLVQIPSPSCQEEAAARFTAEKMAALGYDEVKIDRFGNVIGRVGHGEKVILFDSHTDTVIVTDAEHWAVPPFSGEIKDGYLWGRGSVDMKSGLAASAYAAALAKNQGLLEGKTVYVTGTVVEEDCDGEGLKHALEENHIQPDYAIICEPSANLISTGHKGKAQIIIQTRGVSAHGSAPEKGVNAVYEMAEIIQRIEAANFALQTQGRHGTLVLAQISSTAVSLNAVPSACEVYLDRRLVVAESEQTIQEEMDRITSGKNATWKFDDLQRKTWTGADITYNPLAPAWEISLEHPLAQAFIAACSETFGQPPQESEYWDFSTNAIATVRKGIPTIGFGPGEHKLAHMRDEKCSVDQIVEACAVYTRVINRL
ncbi:MAG TPA: YgeY family selenium metabolism-linked hydrolase [Anaerolineales bacterium]|nr:YgeY family selenium metabolism-linked hydrolase [Anaerolineales bacterium]